MQCQSSRVFARLSSTGAKYYTGHELAAEDTMKLLAQFQGGNVHLSKNEQTGIATICLCRPEKKNAIGGQMLLELNKATEELEDWKCGKGFILYGSNNIFCSGGDLVMSRATTNEEHGFAISSFVQKITTRLRTLPMMSVALIEGVALGGGAEISVAACDWRIMTPDSKIGYVHGKMGLVPGWGGGVALKRLVGASVALDLIMSARLVTAEEALKIGLANEILKTSDNALAQAQDWLQKRVTVSVDILRAAKILMNFGSSDEELKLERSLQAPLWASKAKLDALDKNIKHK